MVAVRGGMMTCFLLVPEKNDGQYRHAVGKLKNNSTKGHFSSTKSPFMLYQTRISLYQRLKFFYQNHPSFDKALVAFSQRRDVIFDGQSERFEIVAAL